MQQENTFIICSITYLRRILPDIYWFLLQFYAHYSILLPFIENILRPFSVSILIYFLWPIILEHVCASVKLVNGLRAYAWRHSRMLLTYSVLKSVHNDSSMHRGVYVYGNAGKQRDTYTRNRDNIKKWSIISKEPEEPGGKAPLPLEGERRAELRFPRRAGPGVCLRSTGPRTDTQLPLRRHNRNRGSVRRGIHVWVR